MGMFTKLSTLIKSNINDLISRAEDPEKMLNQIIIDMRDQFAKAKREVAAAIADGAEREQHPQPLAPSEVLPAHLAHRQLARGRLDLRAADVRVGGVCFPQEPLLVLLVCTACVGSEPETRHSAWPHSQR